MGNCECSYISCLPATFKADENNSAKYLLAIINRSLKVYGKDLGIGYDIACLFLATIAKSSLSAAAQEKALQLVVPAFHGYVHNCACQLNHHPLYVVGFGLEDFEG